MRFERPLLQGKLVRRYQRFLADVELDSGEIVTAHCPNSGSMLSVKTPGSDVCVSLSANPKRRLRYTWELIRVGDHWVGINTSRPNALVAEAVAAGHIPELAGYDRIRREVRYGRNSRIDLLLEGDRAPGCYVEVKNVTMRRGTEPDAPVEFPDSVTERGTKHLRELTEIVASGGRAVMVYLAQRDDGRRFAIAADIDRAYAEALNIAMAKGVEVCAYGCRMSSDAIAVAEPLHLSL